MNKALHVLNGDATLFGFKDTGIAGEVVVWREVLSEGPLLADIHGPDFWKKRSEWIGETFGATEGDHQHKVVDEIKPLSNSSSYSEITLWFEFDLHCQVNLLGVLQLLRGIDLGATALYLVCPSSFPGIENFAGIGQLNAAQLKTLYPQRVRLGKDDLMLADSAWQIYIQHNTAALSHWLSEMQPSRNLTALKPALEAHLKRLTVNDLGLNYIENKLLNLYHNGETTRIEILKAFWKTERIFGMGDLEIDIYLKRLANLQLIPTELL